MTLLPGATIGMLGGGQLGRMFAFEAKRLGYHVIVLDPMPQAPAAQASDKQIVAEYTDIAAAKQLAEECDVITYEFENVPVETVRAIQDICPVLPGAKLLEVAQNRLQEKSTARDNGLDTANFAAVNTQAEFDAAEQEIGYPAVLKTTTEGYDGKGQRVMRNAEEGKQAFADLQGTELIWEQFVEFEKEVSVVCARSQSGEVALYPVGENVHVNNVLHTTTVPANISDAVRDKAYAAAKTLAEALDVVGTFCVELFVTADERVLVNEMAPRPHNSGHYTIEGCVTSQFENQLRAVCGLPLGSTELNAPAVGMLNILGSGEGNTFAAEEIMKLPNVYLHLYGKAEAKAGRKMGHITILAQSQAELAEKFVEVEKLVRWV